MKNLEEFVININEHRGRPRKNPAGPNPAGPDAQGTDKVLIDPEDARKLDALKGLDAYANGSEGIWAVEPPSEKDIIQGVDINDLNTNKKNVLMRLMADKPFFVQGEAGWAKTSIIKKMAKKCGRTVVTVYLDKAEAVDLGGIPVPAKSSRGVDSQKHLMPEWAAVMFDNPNVDFLLFLDEMNQATPDVQAALMPIVLDNKICGVKIPNYIVGAAGNMDYENPDVLYDLAGPLRSRFGGVIKWEKDWPDTIKYLRKTWTDKLSKEFLDEVFKHKDLFNNPRDIESFIIEFVFNLKKKKNFGIFNVDSYLQLLTTIARTKPKLDRSEEVELEGLAEACYNFVNSANTNKRETKTWDISMVQQNVRDAIKRGMQEGFIRINGVNYGVSRENIGDLVNPESCHPEILERLISKYEIDGIKFKYEKDSEWKNAGYKSANDFLIDAKYKPEVSKPARAKKSYDNE